MATPLTGAWEAESDDRQGVIIFTDTHFSLVVGPKNRQRSGSGEASVEEVMEVYKTVAANSGTYTVSGSRATMKRLANIRVEVARQDLVIDYTIDGDKLTFRVVSGGRSSRGTAWRKVS